jgi:hypothetical protein
LSLATAYANAVAGYALNEASGNALDSIGSNDLTQNGTVGAVTGKLDGARGNYSGSNYFDKADNATLSAGDIQLVLRCWVKLNSKGGTMCFAGKGNVSAVGTGEYMLLYGAGSDRLAFAVSDGSGFTTVSANNLGSPATGTWYLLHGWHDSVNNVLGISVNAGTADTVSYSTGIQDGTNNFIVGNDTDHSRALDGYVDDVVLVKNYILDATDRTADYNGGTGVRFADWPNSSVIVPRKPSLVYPESPLVLFEE